MMSSFWTVTPADPLLQELTELFIKSMMVEMRNVNLNYELHSFRFSKELRLSFHTVFNGETIVIQHKIENMDRMSRHQIGALARVTAVMIAQTFGDRLFLSPVGNE